jgi:hypothetical protein
MSELRERSKMVMMMMNSNEISKNLEIQILPSLIYLSESSSSERARDVSVRKTDLMRKICAMSEKHAVM